MELSTQQLVDSVSLGVMVTNPVGHIESMNASLWALLGHRDDALIGQSMAALRLLQGCVLCRFTSR